MTRPVPRRARAGKRVRTIRAWAINLCAAFAVGVIWASVAGVRNVVEPYLFLAFAPIVAFACREWFACEQANLLRNGTATRAVLLEIKDVYKKTGRACDWQSVARFRFVTALGEAVNGVVTVAEGQARKLRAGDTFTVLYYPFQPSSSRPFFMLHDAEVG